MKTKLQLSIVVTDLSEQLLTQKTRHQVPKQPAFDSSHHFGCFNLSFI